VSSSSHVTTGTRDTDPSNDSSQVVTVKAGNGNGN
jgi:hypothetical protein